MSKMNRAERRALRFSAERAANAAAVSARAAALLAKAEAYEALARQLRATAAKMCEETP